MDLCTLPNVYIGLLTTTIKQASIARPTKYQRPVKNVMLRGAFVTYVLYFIMLSSSYWFFLACLPLPLHLSLAQNSQRMSFG